MTSDNKEIRLTVPYYSQFVDIEDKFWMLRACGAVAMKMAVESQGKEMPDILTLCHEAKEAGGYHMENGWIHDYIVARIQKSGLSSYRKERLLDVQEVQESLDKGCPVIVSVEKRVLEQKRFHMILLVGYKKDDTGLSLYYHEPESTNKEKGQYRVCTLETFMNYWRGKAIFLSKPF